jgi:thiamine biosynthesis lipoprotein
MARETRLLMGMPVTVEIVDPSAQGLIARVFEYFEGIDRRFSTYKPESEISAFNRGEIAPSALSAPMREVLALASTTCAETDGYFDIRKPDGALDPSGIVKGWAIRNAANLIRAEGVANFCVDAGGDIEASGLNQEGEAWRVGIRNPFNEAEIVKAVALSGKGIATSGTYVRGSHIYNPHRQGEPPEGIVSLTVIGPDVFEADRFATAAFAMGSGGIHFIQQLANCEGYAIDCNGVATWTTGFGAYVIQ